MKYCIETRQHNRMERHIYFGKEGQKMASFAITTDSSSDLPFPYLQKNEIGLMSLKYMIDGQTYDAFHPMPDHDFYEQMRQGALPTTAQVNPDDARTVLERVLQRHDGLLHIAFSSALSGSCQSASIAAAELRTDYPDKKIIVIDSLAASLGQGLLVHYAVQMRDAGSSLEQTAAWCEANKHRIAQVFTVDDLNHLYRGGRVSKTTAMLGTMFNMKPVLHVDELGKLTPISKVRGRKRALDELVNRMRKQVGNQHNNTVFISHGDCLEDALYVRDRVCKTMGIPDSLIATVGPSIGAHSGPGTVALFFLADRR